MFNTVVLAAGMGTRMKSQVPKVLHKICGKSLCEWVVDAAKEAGAQKICTIVGHKAEMVEDILQDECSFVVQNEQKGTAHAIMQASDFIKNTNGYVVVLNGDTPLITADTIKKAVEFHKQRGGCATVITALLPDADGYERIVRDEDGNVAKIVEQKDATDTERTIKEINSGMYVFDAVSLFDAMTNLSSNNFHNEYYLTDILEIIKNSKKKICAYQICNNDEIMDINDRVQLSEAEEIMRKRIVTEKMKSGVTIRFPQSVYIEADVEIGNDTEICQNVILKRGTKIGSNCVIGMGSQIDRATIHNDVDVLSSVIMQSEICENTHVGPFAYIRPNCHIGTDVKVGDFVELKNANIDDGTKISHLTYIGDADVGKNVNFGCGTVFVNYDGKNKYRTTVGDKAFVGCNTNLVSPVKVGDGAYIAAGSTIVEDVPSDNLAIARARQVNKERSPEWLSARRKDKK